MKNINKSNFFILFFFTSFIFILLTLGARGIFYGVQKLGNNFSLVVFGNRTEGRITSYEGYSSRNKDGKSTRMYRPIIEYKDNKGALRKYRSDYSSSATEDKEIVVIYYQVNDPNKAVRGGFLNIFFWPFIILSMSIFALFIAFYFGQPIFVEIKKYLKKIFKF